MPKPLVAFDLDDLIFPFMDHVVPYLNSRLNARYTIDDYTTFHFEEVFGGTREEAIAHMEGFFNELDPMPSPIAGAADAITKLGEVYSFAIITSRTDDMRNVTLDWLETHFPATFIEVHLTNNYVLDNRPTKRKKADVVGELAATALVDDNFFNVSEVAAAGIPAFLYGDFPWNRQYELPAGVTRVHNWSEVTDALLSLQ